MDHWVVVLSIITVILCVSSILLLLWPPKKKDKKKQSKTSSSKEQYTGDSAGCKEKPIRKKESRYDIDGYDCFGYDAQGFNRAGYNANGFNAKGQYDRFYDTTSNEEEGFFRGIFYPIRLTKHAKERMAERLGVCDIEKMEKLAHMAYRFGRSKRQIKKSSAYLVEEIEMKYDNSIVLIYKGYIYVFTRENELKTVFKNERIPL